MKIVLFQRDLYSSEHSSVPTCVLLPVDVTLTDEAPTIDVVIKTVNKGTSYVEVVIVTTQQTKYSYYKQHNVILYETDMYL